MLLRFQELFSTYILRIVVVHVKMGEITPLDTPSLLNDQLLAVKYQVHIGKHGMILRSACSSNFIVMLQWVIIKNFIKHYPTKSLTAL